MYKHIAIWLLAVGSHFIHAKAQEQLVPLRFNAALTQTQCHIANQRQQNDTLQLPFIDDFSDLQNPLPNPRRWTDQQAFINNGFAFKPITIGTATLDGLDQQGKPYISALTGSSPADTLSSKPINLLGKTPADSVYLSFFYQPEGLGEKPETTDSLLVELFDNQGNWTKIWATAGFQLQKNSPNVHFTYYKHINQTKYLHKGFRFRFRNYTSPNAGGVDHWHIDYVRLAANRTQNDGIDDVAFTAMPTNLLKNYTQVPYSHFKINGNSFLRDTIKISLKNYANAGRNVAFKFVAINLKTNATIKDEPLAAIPLATQATRTLEYQKFALPNISTDSLNIKTTYIINTTPDINRQNDTVKTIQSFSNMYAYDDGSAEYGYGLNTTNGKIACKFKLAKSDTLRAVKLLFTQILASNSTIPFKLTVWKTLVPEVILYQKTVVPIYKNGLNTFVDYLLDSPIWVADSVFVGWQQTSQDLLNIGLDRNTNANANMFFKVDANNWQNSSIAGSWLIRPVFDVNNVYQIGINERPNGNQRLNLYPNPAQSTLIIDVEKPTNIEITDVLGQNITHQCTIIGGNQIDVQALANGIYFIKINNNKGQSAVGKFIKE